VRGIEETTFLVTGATDGLGRAVATRLAQMGAGTLLLHGRNQQKLDLVERDVKAEGAGDTRTYVADFSSLAEVRRMAEAVSGDNAALHVLINNAGIGSGRPDLTTRQESQDGYELRFAVNYLAGLLLTLRLLPLLRESAPARVVNVASIGQAPIDFDDPQITENYTGMRAYGQSKLAQITAGFVLAEKIPPSEITFNSLHPATFMPTKIVTAMNASPIDTVSQGVEATVMLATDAELDGKTGLFFNRTMRDRAADHAYEDDYRARLWALSLELLGEEDV